MTDYGSTLFTSSKKVAVTDAKSKPRFRTFLKSLSVLPAGLVLAAQINVASAEVNTTGLAVTDTEVTVGILHSLTGTMAISETGAQQAEKLAIQQINDMGGILGRQLNYSRRRCE